MLPAYSLARTTSGLLAINAWNSDSLPGSAIPFVVADWTYSTGMTGSISPTHQLSLTNSSNTLWYVAQRTSIASRGKTFMFAMASNDSSAAALGPAAHITQVSTPTCVMGGVSVQRGGGDLARLVALVAGTPTALASTSVTTKTSNVNYKMNVFVDATVVVVRDLTAGVTVSGTYAGSSGQVGVFAQFNGITSYSRWIAMTDRFVTVSGLPAGATVDIQTPSATTLVVGGDESSGTATIDLMLVDVSQAKSIRVMDHLGTVLATFQDPSGASKNLIAGGDTFALSAGPVGAQTIALQAVKLASIF